MQKKDGGPALKPADQPKQQLQWSQWYVYLKQQSSSSVRPTPERDSSPSSLTSARGTQGW